MSFDNQVVLVTGAASQIGIGCHAARRFAELGARVAICDTDAEGLAQTRKAIESRGGQAKSYTLSVADTSAVDAMVAELEETWGSVDVLVNNAGIARTAPFTEMTDEQLNQTMDVNFGGTVRCSRAVAPGMIRRNSGVILSVSSIEGHAWGWPAHGHYCASKGAIEGLTRALAVELGPHCIRVNAVAPGLIWTAQSTDPVNSVGPDGLEKLTAAVPLRRVARPEEMAEFLATLASPAAGYMTGQTVVFDGGITLGELTPLLT
ncbi:SDR family oxidoreductase [Methylonatrum kenyense]|uniref:SDR family NAD(P)-dependent oxidoreductase n=1 Tax=Methylonatrum kenyense TaxID=455253 RepID=UPI0020BD4ADC|nr:SDR family NAD(P)-dependent oxidoreductase [Methylonatrum kenyense]MCK8514925.1 SDR family oxidoreductase [Methylonatrum kenyense]